MALGDSYATITDFKNYITSYTAGTSDDQITESLEAASREIERRTHRQFNQVSIPTTRSYETHSGCSILVDDFFTAAGLVVTAGGRTLTADDYRLEPLNGVVDGVPGWPYYRIRAREHYRFPTYHGVALVEVTAAWGWPEVPKAVKQACTALANDNLKTIRDMAFGIANSMTAGAQFARDNPRVARWLAPYVRLDGTVA